MLQINMWIDHRTSRLCVAHALVVPGYPLGPPLLGTPASVILGYNGPKEAPMYFEQFYLGCLSHASYMAGSEGVAAGIDPQRDVEIYLEARVSWSMRPGVSALPDLSTRRTVPEVPSTASPRPEEAGKPARAARLT